MKSMKQIISILLTLAMTMSMITIPALAEETTEIEKVITDNTVLTEPFDVTNEEEVDAGLYPYDQKTVLVKFAKKTNTLDVDSIASIEYLFKAKDGFWYTAHLAEGTTPKMAIEALRSTPSVLVAEYNFLYETGATTLCDNEGVSADVSSNGKSKDQWHLDSCGFQKAWKKLKNDKKNPGGDSGIVVAVIDTGVDFDHEDLKNNMWTNQGEVPGDGIDNDKNGYVDDYYGVNIVAKKGNGDDDHGHGTHVAGIIAAGNNNVGVVGLAYNTKIMAIKAGQASGYFLNTDVCKAIDYARENGADVINMSFGSTATTIAVQDALEEAYTHSVLVAAAGNDGANNEPTPTNPIAKPCYPAAYSFVLGVMAVDDFGTEASFTNYDVYGFNSVEYELYAPGNAITSTIPNDKYATWNGTSMAAPIVSAMAAVLRSVYSDPDMYPTKFIYGQLASTSERHAECLDPKVHGMHNLPQIANLYDALYKMPKPDVSLSEYKTFDTSDIDKNNNGDGTIDSGETISLGFELRNRWGMSEDTIVTIDAISQADIPNPYVEFSADGKKFDDSASINYKSVGTYSTQDCGKIIEDDLWTGWENPFYVKVAKDAPNETILKINVNITCKNALDADDKSTYSSDATIELIVKNGVVLPQIIDEDMTLTKDNYYIIQNSTVIEEGATVTVTEGTNIQFWTNDSTDPYADQYMASLVVKGKLNCIGTEEEPVKIFPSDLMSKYRVEIFERENGEINYNYTNITNLMTCDRRIEGSHYSYDNAFTKAENCVFDRSTKVSLYFRYLESGRVSYSSQNILSFKGGIAKNCVFYKLGGAGSGNMDRIKVNCENCMFVDSQIEFGKEYSYNNCVFLGNNNWDNTYGGTSSMEVLKTPTFVTVQKVVHNETTGKTYVKVSGGNAYSYNKSMLNHLAEYIGGTLACIETEEEFNFLKKSQLRGILGTEKVDGENKWVTGEEFGNFIPENVRKSSSDLIYFASDSSNYIYSISTYSSDILIELDDKIYVEEISLAKGKIAVDTAVTYQLAPVIYPSTAKDHKLLYFSSNEAIATVDETGRITPVTTGTATIYAFSEDMQVSASMTVEVKDEVKATSIKVPETMQVNIGEIASLNAVIKPTSTTKTATYKSSDEAIATVDADGNITAVSKGEATITTSVSNGDEVITAETLVSVVVPVETINFGREMFYVKPGENKVIEPVITPANATNQNLIWDSSNPEFCYVNENGELVGVAEGMATLKATVENTDLSAFVIVCVSEAAEDTTVVDLEYFSHISVKLKYAVTGSGKLCYWGTDYKGNVIKNPKILEVTSNGEPIDVAEFAFINTRISDKYKYLILDKSGNLYSSAEMDYSYLWTAEYKSADGEKRCYKDSFELVKENVKKLLSNSNVNVSNTKTGNYCIAIMEDGTVSTSGYNYNGAMGIGGSSQYISEFINLSIADEKIVDGYAGLSFSYLFSESGNLYMAKYGGDFEYYAKVYEGVDRLQNGVAIVGDEFFVLNESATPTLKPVEYENQGAVYTTSAYSTNYYGIIDGVACISNYIIPKLTNISQILFSFGAGWYAVTENGELYSISAYSTTLPTFIPFTGDYIESAPVLREGDTNLVDFTYEEGNVSGVLKDDTLQIGFDSKISSSNQYNYITLAADGKSNVVVKSYDLNNMYFKVSGGFKEGVEYILTIPADAVVNDASLGNEKITITFTYQPDEEEIEEEIPEIPEIPEEEEEPSEPKHVHEFETETVMPTLEAEGKITNVCECGVTSETVLPKLTKRDGFTAEDYTRLYNEFIEKGFDTNVSGSAILNRLNDDDVTKWLRIMAPSGEAKYGFGGNWWGTTNPELINHQIVDYNDFITLGDINEGEFLTKAPENTFPFVTEAYLTDESGEVQSIVSGGKVKFVVKFNRDMDMDYGAKVFFGSTYPYADYEIEGSFADARTWVGETELKTVIENGYQFIRVTNGRTAADENGAHLKLYDDWARFGFEIDTTSAMAMMMQGYADNDGIHLEWMQDDYDTLAGYNVYRADTEDGNYVRINKTIISSDENTFTDTDVEPGKKYYYTFTVVLTDATDSKPAGKISVTAKDTMAPSVYHSPVYTATTGNKVIISATVSDNIGIESAELLYRVKGTTEWKTAKMTNSNSKYTASIPAAFVTLSGVEYYIAAFDGVNYTCAGSHTSENPYEIAVYQAVENNAKGDVDGDGNITVLDALKLLRAIYDESLLTQEEFLRADINGDGSLSAVEALRILQYANKTISSVLW